MYKKLLILFLSLLLVTAFACKKSSDEKTSANDPLSADYERSVATIAPSVSSASTASRAITATGVSCSSSTVLNNIGPSSTDLYKQWVGWDNDNGGALSPSDDNGWMPFKEDDSTCVYIDIEAIGDYGTTPGTDDVPDLKNYAVLNKVFFGSGTDTIYGAAQFLDTMITSINESLDTTDPVAATITLPSWFGNVYTTETTATNVVSLDNEIDMSDDISSSSGIEVLKLGYSNDATTGEQVVLIYMQFGANSQWTAGGSQVSLFYARKDNANSVYLKSSFIDFSSSGTWSSSHMTELRTKGNDYIIRKANKIFGTGEACCPTGTIYSHALVGGGSIDANSFFALRWLEGRYDYSGYSKTTQPTVTEMRNSPILSSAIYYIVQYDPTAEYNAKFKPLYGKGQGGGATSNLPTDLATDTGTTLFTQKPECAIYTNADQFFTQAELPGWAGDTVSIFGSWSK